MNKWLVEYTGGSLQVAGVTSGGSLQIESAFGFQIAGITDPEEIACAIEKIQAMRQDSDCGYWNEITIKTTGSVYIHKLQGCTCSIVVNNCRVVYHGLIDRLDGLPRALRKAEMKLNKGVDNE
jgi:hypothetical protein